MTKEKGIQPERAEALSPGVEIENLDTARFRCVFPSCGGVCCTNARPPVEDSEREVIDANLPGLLDLLRPSAKAHIEKHGWLTNRVKGGLRTIAVQGGWCVFENSGCTLQRAGMAEGDPWKYKPSVCARFPLEQSARDGKWYVRQWGYRGEVWDLFCLNPKEDPTPASELRAEIALVEKIESGNRTN